MSGEIDYFKIALIIAAVTGAYILFCFATSGNAEKDAKRRGLLEIAWPLFFICTLGLLLVITEFAAVLLLAGVITGVVLLVDKFTAARKRSPEDLEPVLVDMARAFFPVVVVVFLIRSFWIEPFKIPSGSMRPTLLEGDFILVNKYVYGLRLPVLNIKITEGTPVQRGDVVVFRYPHEPNKDYIKRTIGLPGDTVEYKEKRLIVNGQPLPVQLGERVAEKLGRVQAQTFRETIGGKSHTAQVFDGVLPLPQTVLPFRFKNENCKYNAPESFVCKVPEGHYLMIGDNRDDSYDGRYWGFVPDDHLRGRAFYVWMNFSNFKRIGTTIE